MKKRNIQRLKPSAAQRPMPWGFFILTILCACIVAAGFFFAARQHFMTMELGLRNSKLRKQIEDLESERRRLVLSKEVSLSPVELTRNAKAMGLREHTEQPEAAIVRDVKPPTETQTAEPVLTSFRPSDKPQTTPPTEKEKDTKKLVKQIVQTTATNAKPVKPAAPNERPRLVADADKRVAQAPAKPTSKFR